MKITIQRSGGFAAITRVWTVVAASSEEKERWMPIVEACPWDDVAPPAPPAGQADRFIYSIRAGQRQAKLPETQVTGPWHVLVECAQTEGEESRQR